MKNKLIYFMLILFTVSACNQTGVKKNVKLETAVDSASYAIGVLVGTNNKQQVDMVPGGKELNLEIISAAFRKATVGEETVMTPEEANGIISTFIESAGAKEAQINLEEGNAYLENNKGRSGVQVTSSGLQYEIITEGTGAKPGPEDQVQVHYHGTLIDGTVFDSSVDRGEPATFQVNAVIEGWTEALQLMPVGSKWKIYIPSSLGYGENGAGGLIGPNSALIFEVELLDIVQ
ncbi:MAG: FKBP-type peptidyl-prolyl cis-trans isomerase [Bacteroidales bacterium]|jgi:FKBP-type peptidyl-prolyl cis-trans isomerase|nr:FKBP-type peptidyl-prolyl cis-trans isomerase [Bacteroidales bacterium]